MTALRRVAAPPTQAGVAVVVAAAALATIAAGRPGPALGIAVGAALLAATLVWPELATVAVVACVWLNLPALAVDRFHLPLLVGASFPFLLLAPLLHARLRGGPLVLTRTFALLAALLVVELLSSLAAAHQDVAVARLRVFALEGVILYLLTVNAVRTPETLRRTIWALLGAGAFLAAITVYQQLTSSYYRPYLGFGQVDGAYFRGQSDVARLAGPLGDPNYYAQILIPIVPLALLSIRRERARSLRLAAAATAALVCAAIAFTYSRGAAVALVAVLLAMAALGYVRARQLAVLALGVALLLAAVPSYRNRVESITSIGGATAQPGQQTSADQSTRSRTTEMAAAGLAFLDHPLLGVGPGGFPRYYAVYAPRVGIEVRETTKTGPHAGEVPERAAHDIVLGIAADLGLAGVSVFACIVLVSFRDLLRARRRSLARRPDVANLVDSLFLALLAYLVAGLFLSLAFERYFWLLAALAGAAGSIGRGSRTAAPPP